MKKSIIDSLNLNIEFMNEIMSSNPYKRKFTKPIIKWVGGKTDLLNKVISKFPTEINNYHEPFLGGGSVSKNYLDLKEKNRINVTGKIYACDYNEGLINLFKNIQNHKEELYK